MRKLVILSIAVMSFIGCKTDSEKKETVKEEAEIVKQDNYLSFGEVIDAENSLNSLSATETYEAMALNDTTDLKFTAKVNAVCKAKGCWMRLKLDNGEEVMVKFKDYGFFVPKDIENKEVVVNGKAFVNEVPIDEQQHYAKDAGKTEEEVAAITEPKKTYSFIADGVLIRK
ncbi:DUF4920 domain-containing protein [Leptobacterium flavescens]|uniref:DUF4920 domain-containing protein n=1 Tax=Leptobacterium flavescens TaxID=472055 RepID=A0A6P0USE7_9FLAO|nr:DUF4920 domain-containing protein [Leptobacterium flavescens]NER15450.1 DUF4920 domain-containing protein [Leptobacterium flavescens]